MSAGSLRGWDITREDMSIDTGDDGLLYVYADSAEVAGPFESMELAEKYIDGCFPGR